MARRAEELGYSSYWTAETTGPEAFSLLTAAGAAAPGLATLGTGVLALQLRTPPLAAMSAATLASLQPGREVLLGVGISSPVVTQRWHGAPYGEHPLGQVREYVELVRACLSGEKVDFAGDHYAVKGFRLGLRQPEVTPRIVLGALGPAHAPTGRRGRRRRAAQLPAGLARPVVGRAGPGRRGGGRARPRVVPRLRLRPRRGGRPRRRPSTNGRKDLFSYAVVDSYADSFTKAGFGDEVAAIREHHAAGDRAGAVAAVSDAMVDAIDVVGDADLVTATDAGLPRRRGRRGRADAAAVGPRPPSGRRRHPGRRHRRVAAGYRRPP